MKNITKFIAFLLVSAMLCALAACGDTAKPVSVDLSAPDTEASEEANVETEPEKTSKTSAEPIESEAAADTSVVSDEVLASINDAYDETIREILTGCANHWADTTPDALSVSLVYNYCDETIGFVKQDINGDGIPELIIGENLPEDTDAEYLKNHDYTTVYDIFTADAEGNISHPVCGGERDRFYVFDTGILREEGSNGASSNFVNYWMLTGSELSEAAEPDTGVTRIRFNFDTTLGEYLAENATTEDGAAQQ